MEHIKEFSRFACSYDDYTDIQKQVVQTLVQKIHGTPQKILDLGCGSGAVYKNLGFTCKEFIGVDSSLKMCQLHPKNKNIILHNKNFESLRLKDFLLKNEKFDLIISSSALQWAKNLENVVYSCKEATENILFALFTSNTFKTIFELTGLSSPLPCAQQIVNTVQKHYDIKYEIVQYKLTFEDNLSKFRYIKRSGVSGGKRQLNVSQTKKLIKEYPHNYLEFEVIYIQNK